MKAFDQLHSGFGLSWPKGLRCRQGDRDTAVTG